MKKLLLLSLITSSLSYAQSDVVTSGGNASSTSGSGSYTIGQVDYISAAGTTGNINQGVQQPYEIYGPLEVISIEGLTIEIYPNPTQEFIYVELDNSKIDNCRILLYDINGKLIKGNLITSEKSEINMAELATGNYYIEISSNDLKICSYKIIKN